MGYSNEEGLILKTKSMVISLFSIISGSSSWFPSTPIQIPNQCSSSAYNQCLKLPAGLKTLIYAPQTQSPTHPNPLIIHSYTIPQPTASSLILSSPDFQSLFRTLSTHSSSFSSCSSGMDDMLGTESGVYMSPNELRIPELERGNGVYNNGENKRKQQQRGCPMAGEYPPVIPLLARTGNLPGHMPWILTRHYNNGRLVLKEEKVKHHEYFESYRENGRLILNLVPLDGTVTCCHAVCEEDDIDNGQEVELENIGEEYDQDHETEADDDDYVEEEENYQGYSIPTSSALSVPKFFHGNGSYGDPRKCSTYSGRFLSELSSMFSNGAFKQQQLSTPAPLAFCNFVPAMKTTDEACLVN